MSALGQKQTCAAQKVMSALPPKADIAQVIRSPLSSTLCPPFKSALCLNKRSSPSTHKAAIILIATRGKSRGQYHMRTTSRPFTQQRSSRLKGYCSRGSPRNRPLTHRQGARLWGTRSVRCLASGGEEYEPIANVRSKWSHTVMAHGESCGQRQLNFHTPILRLCRGCSR